MRILLVLVSIVLSVGALIGVSFGIRVVAAASENGADMYSSITVASPALIVGAVCMSALGIMIAVENLNDANERRHRAITGATKR